MYNIHRADLIQLLSDAVPAEAKRLGARCVALSQDKDGVEVTLHTGPLFHVGTLMIVHGAEAAQNRGPNS